MLADVWEPMLADRGVTLADILAMRSCCIGIICQLSATGAARKAPKFATAQHDLAWSRCPLPAIFNDIGL